MAHAKKTPILFFLLVNLQISKREPEPEEKKTKRKGESPSAIGTDKQFFLSDPEVFR